MAGQSAPQPRQFVILFDGTWNDHLASSTPTNVLKLFHALDGVDLDFEDDDSPTQRQQKESPAQRVCYLTGVGSNEGLGAPESGIYGLGVITRVVRAWMWLTRHYRPGDRIALVGFSRGAYTACIFARLLIDKGVLPNFQQEFEHRPAASSSSPTADWKNALKLQYYQEGLIRALHWYVNRPGSVDPIPKSQVLKAFGCDYLDRQAHPYLSKFFRAFGGGQTLIDDLAKKWPEDTARQQVLLNEFLNRIQKTQPEVPNLKITEDQLTLGLWDCVPALGAVYSDVSGRHVLHASQGDMKFCSPKDCTGTRRYATIFHAISLDEGRKNYSPRVFKQKPHVTQMFFSGCHADVGGGYSFLTGDPASDDKIRSRHLRLATAGDVHFIDEGSLQTLFSHEWAHHESCLSDISLAWMITRLSGTVIFKREILDFARQVEATDWTDLTEMHFFQIEVPALTRRRGQGLWVGTIQLRPFPRGIAHMELVHHFPRLYDTKVPLTLHHSVLARQSQATDDYRYYLHNLAFIGQDDRLVQYRHHLREFHTSVVHIHGNEAPTAPIVTKSFSLLRKE